MGSKRKQMRAHLLKQLLIFFLLFSFVLCGISETIATEALSNYTAEMIVDGVNANIAYFNGMLLVPHPSYDDIVNITVPEKKIFIVMSNSNMTYFEKSINPDFYKLDIVVEKTKKGSQVIDGHPCTIYEGVFYQKGKPDDKNEMTEWAADDMGGLIIKRKTRDYQTAKQNIKE